MHELGHTLGLTHGGISQLGEKDDTNYKPNYLSVMNYCFQLSGLCGDTAIVNYSEYNLPLIDETNLDEHVGIDPDSVTAKTGLGTILFGKGGSQINNIAGSAIDFNNNRIIENHVVLDLNDDGKETKLADTTNDWNQLIFMGGSIGQYGVDASKEIDLSQQVSDEALEEITLPEALERGLLSSGHVHDWETEYIVDKPATCTEDGSKSIHCKTCDAVKNATIIPALGHDWDDGTITIAPTEVSVGEKIYKCSVCGETKRETIPTIVDDNNPDADSGPDLESNSDTNSSSGIKDKKVNNSGQENNSMVETGDNSIFIGWISLLIISGVIITMVFSLKRWRNIK